ncbi:hypothetical protein NQ166_03120 [Microbacterium sp. zg.Y1090]|uniref:hypothetical protein n=1 Tax=Microbacterium TaxID=33882 RepID=UPI00214D0762|nr:MULTISPECIES: hypothetical protein [unclassified Microbacterium]MCR2812380.1 hypothetical protein [Microbacterium sp. zg.Y1084]MCR2817819.1 hypothetical protein [Microbacterium sp. zg.Y1090]MDL5485537.1 hypothetical protein [Microbacterium sp. zg-Y1211]WIM28708.1 hypothetical protein QNO26_02095 [Microbacterium sp. zg-Y1090]
MTVMLDAAPTLEERQAAAWFPVETGFWVANTGGRYLGAVERLRSGEFSARDATGAEVGCFGTLAEARDAVTSEAW